jgi:hypothetical protein
MYQTWRSPKWEPVNLARVKQKKCPRCGNETDFLLVSDTAYGITFFGFMILPLKKAYALKCSICPHYDEIDSRQARAFAD